MAAGTMETFVRYVPEQPIPMRLNNMPSPEPVGVVTEFVLTGSGGTVVAVTGCTDNGVEDREFPVSPEAVHVVTKAHMCRVAGLIRRDLAGADR